MTQVMKFVFFQNLLLVHQTLDFIINFVLHARSLSFFQIMYENSKSVLDFKSDFSDLKLFKINGMRGIYQVIMCLHLKGTDLQARFTEL